MQRHSSTPKWILHITRLLISFCSIEGVLHHDSCHEVEQHDAGNAQEKRKNRNSFRHAIDDWPCGCVKDSFVKMSKCPIFFLWPLIQDDSHVNSRKNWNPETHPVFFQAPALHRMPSCQRSWTEKVWTLSRITIQRVFVQLHHLQKVQILWWSPWPPRQT